MLTGKHSAILSAFIKQPSVVKIFVLSIFEWPLYTGFTVKNKKSKNIDMKQTRSAVEPCFGTFLFLPTIYRVYC